MNPVYVRDRQFAVAASVKIVAAVASFHGLEVGQHLFIGPADIAQRRPVVEVGGLAAVVTRPLMEVEPPSVRPCGMGIRRPWVWALPALENCQAYFGLNTP